MGEEAVRVRARMRWVERVGEEGRWVERWVTRGWPVLPVAPTMRRVGGGDMAWGGDGVLGVCTCGNVDCGAVPVGAQGWCLSTLPRSRRPLRHVVWAYIFAEHCIMAAETE